MPTTSNSANYNLALIWLTLFMNWSNVTTSRKNNESFIVIKCTKVGASHIFRIGQNLWLHEVHIVLPYFSSPKHYIIKFTSECVEMGMGQKSSQRGRVGWKVAAPPYASLTNHSMSWASYGFVPCIIKQPFSQVQLTTCKLKPYKYHTFIYMSTFIMINQVVSPL